MSETNTIESETNGYNNAIEDELEWEEWDGKSPFTHHCIAGGIAGIMEHTLLYPVDTIKTHMQSYCADCPHNVKNANISGSSSSGIRSSLAASSADQGMWRTMQSIMLNGNNHSHSSSKSKMGINTSSASRPVANFAATCFPGGSAGNIAEVVPKNQSFSTGFGRLWRGVQTMAVGCAPAHALYFSSYEAIKSLFLSYQDSNSQKQHHLSPVGSSVAGATATIFHDLIMSPLDTLKQRLQLGHYEGMYNGAQQILKHEGYIGLYRSFPVTLLSNVPYGMIMVSTNEFLKEILNPDGQFDLRSCLVAGCGAGFVAGALTTPLDRVKTRLQTQALGIVSNSISSTSSSSTASVPCGSAITKCGRPIPLQQPPLVKYEGWRDAIKSIIVEEGYAGLFRGVLPRVLMHSPAVAITWTSYEGAKKWLLTLSE